MSDRQISDAEALDQIVEQYRTWGQEGIFENTDSTIEFIGDVIAQTGRQAWFEEPGYLSGSAPCPLCVGTLGSTAFCPSCDQANGIAL